MAGSMFEGGVSNICACRIKVDVAEPFGVPKNQKPRHLPCHFVFLGFQGSRDTTGIVFQRFWTFLRLPPSPPPWPSRRREIPRLRFPVSGAASVEKAQIADSSSLSPDILFRIGGFAEKKAFVRKDLELSVSQALFR